jgi:hypothetical protein
MNNLKHNATEASRLASSCLDSFFMGPEDIRVPGMGDIWKFAKGTGFL